MIAQNSQSKSKGRAGWSSRRAKKHATAAGGEGGSRWPPPATGGEGGTGSDGERKASKTLAANEDDTSAYISPLLTRIPGELLETFHYLVSRLSAEDKLPPRIAVVAATHREGTTMVSRMLAAMLVNDLNRSVCLVDVDPRHSQDNPESGEPPVGLFQVLAHDLPVDAAITPTGDARLHVLGAGVVGSLDGREMLRSTRLAGVFDELEAKFDHVIVDVPPILAGSNSLALMRHLPSYLMVVRHGATPVDQVASAVAQLPTHTSLGVVLNGFSSKVPKGLRRFFSA